ncbi:hypothetical protein LXA43DRAFT_884301, partial [Ganoderma leucocontextum]
QRWCVTLLHSEIGEMLLGMKRRFELLNVDNPWAVIVDSCCHFRNMILDVYPDAVVLQDIWHVIMRYMVCILGGSKNAHQREVGEDISSALIKSKAHDGIPARYWSKEEQEERLEQAFIKWATVGGVWSAAAPNTHRQQLEHVRKGCLARPRDDVATDGSRIEGTHKGWNALQRTHPSGVKVLTDLAADHVLRHNIRVDGTHATPYPFTKATFGSHHVYLVNACAQRWNALLQPTAGGQKRPPADLLVATLLEPADSNEAFGLVKANKDVEAYHTFVTLKDEPDDALLDLSTQDPEYAERVAASLGLDPALLSQPLALAANSSATSASTTLSRAQQEHADAADPTADVSEKRSRSSQPDAPSSSAFIATNPLPSASTLSASSTPDPSSAPGPSSSSTAPSPSSSSTAPGPSSSSSVPGLSSSSSAPGAPGPSSSMSQVPSRAPSILGHLPSFFAQCRLESAEPVAKLVCLPAPVITGQTRSQRLISAATGFDPRSLKFPKNDDIEYFLFMDLRAQYKWATYNMSAAAWVDATSIYNTALEKKKGKDAIRKTPRALMEKLEAIEVIIHQRNKNKDYKSQSGSTDFWERHCNAVDLLPGKPSKGKGKTRKPHTCHRCLSTMWAGGEGGRDNHKKGYCSDGVKQKSVPVDGVMEELPPWPQPNGIFTKGDTFWPKRFTGAVRELYDTVIVGHELGGIKAMEYLAFADMLRARLIVIPPTETEPSIVRFKLYRGLALGEQPDQPSDLVTIDGADYLHVSYLSEDGFHEVAALATGST